MFLISKLIFPSLQCQFPCLTVHHLVCNFLYHLPLLYQLCCIIFIRFSPYHFSRYESLKMLTFYNFYYFDIVIRSPYSPYLVLFFQKCVTPPRTELFFRRASSGGWGWGGPMTSSIFKNVGNCLIRIKNIVYRI